MTVKQWPESLVHCKYCGNRCRESEWGVYCMECARWVYDKPDEAETGPMMKSEPANGRPGR